jgi:hypothetical protein
MVVPRASGGLGGGRWISPGACAKGVPWPGPTQSHGARNISEFPSLQVLSPIDFKCVKRCQTVGRKFSNPRNYHHVFQQVSDFKCVKPSAEVHSAVLHRHWWIDVRVIHLHWVSWVQQFGKHRTPRMPMRMVIDAIRASRIKTEIFAILILPRHVTICHNIWLWMPWVSGAPETSALIGQGIFDGSRPRRVPGSRPSWWGRNVWLSRGHDDWTWGLRLFRRSTVKLLKPSETHIPWHLTSLNYSSQIFTASSQHALR